MIEIKSEDFILKPYPYQLDGIKHLLTRNNAAIFDEMGVGKSKQAIDAASILFQNNMIDAVIVVSPASVRGVWDGAETGEIAKHCASDYVIYRYDNKFKHTYIPSNSNQLTWITISYSFLRARLDQFLNIIKKTRANRPFRFMLIFDESSYVKSKAASQTTAAWKLRQFADRCVLLNGTPIANNVIDLWAQFNILDPEAIDHMNYYHFRARYCIMGGFKNKQVFSFSEKQYESDKARLQKLRKTPAPNSMQKVDEKVLIQIHMLEKSLEVQEKVRENVERLKRKLAPWIIRREKKDVLKDLPAKLPPVLLEAPLSNSAWKLYCDMRDEMIAWANEAVYSEAINGAVKVGRLSQITSGFLGGSRSNDGEETVESLQEIDDAKLSTFLEWYESNSHLKILVWCRFRAEMFRLKKALEDKGVKVGMLIGGQPDSERQEGINAFRSGGLDVMLGNPGAGGFGLDGFQTHCYTCVYLSLDHSLIKFQQSSDRLHRNGQTMPVSYIFIVATSPSGKKTVDHMVIDAVTHKEDMANWSMDKWRTKLKAL